MNIYHANDTALTSLEEKTLIMIVGPTSIGKSTLMQKIAEIDKEFSYVQAFTTRPRRSDAPSTYRHISETEAANLYKNHQAITYIPHPTTGYIYGTDHASYKTTYNLLDTMSGSVQLYRGLPFAKTVTISITAELHDWKRWLGQRFPEESHELHQRLVEAKTSIEWSLNQNHDHAWLVNSESGLEDCARRVIDHARGRHALSETAPHQATDLLAYVENLLS